MRAFGVYFFVGYPLKEYVFEICVQVIIGMFDLGCSFLQVSIEENGYFCG